MFLFPARWISPDRGGIIGPDHTETGENMGEPEEKGWRYAPHVIVFFSSAFIMVVELVAGRLIARHLGNSLYTWTSIIGVILAGMSIGNYVGGRLADRWRPEQLLGPLFLSASLVCLSVVPLNQFFSDS